MNFPAISIILLVAASLCLTALIHKRRKEEGQLIKEANFEDIRTTVTKDVLRENIEQLTKNEDSVKKMKKELEALREKLLTRQAESKNVEVETEQCNGEAKSSADSVANLEGEKNSLSHQFETERAEWSKEIASLKEEAGQQSKVCAFILRDSDEGRKLCGIPAEAPEQKKEESKADGPDATQAPKQR